LKKSQKHSQKIVVKVGSSILTGGGTTLVQDNLMNIVDGIARFIQNGDKIILVTSGAIACGLSALGFKKRPKDLAEQQAAAAVGQNILMHSYSVAFAKKGLKCAQILLTREDFADRKRYLNAKNTINTLLAHHIVAVINENDAVSVDEIKFGDNDTLSARVAAAVEADGLLIVTDIDGLYESFDPKTKKGKLINFVKKITSAIEHMACGTDKDSCVGGMSSKIEAARIATNMGIPTVTSSTIALNPVSIDFRTLKLADPYYYGCGTGFAAPESIGAKKHWIAFEAKTKGKIYVDAGAKAALVQKQKSLLAPGIIMVEGHFKADEIVEIANHEGDVFAKGKVNFSSEEVLEIKGKKAKEEVVHRDNLVILG